MTELAETATWHDRYDMIGQPFEAQVRQMFRDRDWEVSACDLLDRANNRVMRNVIERAYPCSPLRWMPDFLVARSLTFTGPEMCWIDAKSSSHGEKAQGSVALAALEAQRRWSAFTGVNVFYVFGNGLTATIADFTAKGSTGPIIPGRGSGEPYLLLEQQFCTPFDERFGASRVPAEVRGAPRPGSNPLPPPPPW